MAETVEFRCPHCNQLYRLGREQLARYSGKTINCRKCHQPFTFTEAPAPQVPSEPHEQAFTSMTPTPQVPVHESAPGAPPSMPTVGEPPPEQTPAPVETAAPRRPAAGGTTLGDVLTFRYMITPVAIQVIFWIGVAVSLITAITLISQGRIIHGVVTIIFGPVLVRIYCEILIVIFRVYDALREIRDELRQR